MSDIRTNKYLKGVKPEDAQFEDRAAMIEAMQNPLYKHDPEYRALVGHMLQRPFGTDEAKGAPAAQVVSGRTLARAMSDPESARKQELAQVAKERYQAMFLKKDENGNNLYEKSASYREEVRQFLIDNDAAIDAQMAPGTIVNRDLPQHRHAMRVTIGQFEDEAKNIRAERDAKVATQAAEELAEAHRRLDRGEAADIYDASGLKIN